MGVGALNLQGTGAKFWGSGTKFIVGWMLEKKLGQMQGLGFCIRHTHVIRSPRGGHTVPQVRLNNNVCPRRLTLCQTGMSRNPVFRVVSSTARHQAPYSPNMPGSIQPLLRPLQLFNAQLTESAHSSIPHGLVVKTHRYVTEVFWYCTR